MAKTLLEYAEWLTERKLLWPAPPPVESAKATPMTKPLPGIRAVTFEVYGTLLRITDGRLVHRHPQALRMELALDKTIQEFNMWNSMTRKMGKPWEQLQTKYLNGLEEQQMASSGRKGDVTEVNSATLWRKLIGMLDKKDYQYDQSFYGDLDEFAAKVAYYFHSCLQGIEAAPGGLATLSSLSAAGVRVALLTDGQPFTAAQVLHAIQRCEQTAVSESLLSSSLNTISADEGVKKPSRTLYLRAVERFAQIGIAPEQILHIGTRLKEDLSVAKSLRMRTALYAAEKLPLQATSQEMSDPALRPDRLLTKLDQIRDVVGV